VEEEQQSMPTRFEDPIEVPIAVLDGLESVRESGETNLQDAKKVQAIAARLGYPEVVAWIEDHPREYQEGMYRGFVAAEQPLA
jgi:Domain of unknown function (DUF5049)